MNKYPDKTIISSFIATVLMYLLYATPTSNVASYMVLFFIVQSILSFLLDGILIEASLCMVGDSILLNILSLIGLKLVHLDTCIVFLVLIHIFRFAKINMVSTYEIITLFIILDTAMSRIHVFTNNTNTDSNITSNT